MNIWRGIYQCADSYLSLCTKTMRTNSLIFHLKAPHWTGSCDFLPFHSVHMTHARIQSAMVHIFLQSMITVVTKEDIGERFWRFSLLILLCHNIYMFLRLKKYQVHCKRDYSPPHPHIDTQYQRWLTIYNSSH